jgi:hypothetical protein
MSLSSRTFRGARLSHRVVIANLRTSNRRRFRQAFYDLEYRDVVEHHGTSPLDVPRNADLVCYDSDQAVGFEIPSIVAVSRRGHLSRSTLRALVAERSAVIEDLHVTAETVARAVAEAMTRTNLTLREYLTDHPLVADIPLRVISGFVDAPLACKGLKDLARILDTSVWKARVVVRELGIARTAHLWTRMRCASWVWMVDKGLPPRVAETTLGMPDRATFRRSCRRANVTYPWHLSSR